MLSLLVGAVAVLVFGTAAPRLRFIVVTEHGFRVDETSLTPLPSGATALNASRLIELAKRLHEADSERFSETETYTSVADFVAETSPASGEKLVIYCAVDALCVAGKESVEKIELELLPAKLSDERIRFSAFLGGIKQRTPSQTVLLLELTGRSPGLASGSVADEIRKQVEQEIDAAGISGLTVICANDKGERSWEYVAAAAAGAGTESADKASLPEGFRGTAFGHFIEQAFVEGKATTAAQLFATLEADVSQWVSGHFGETQTVWMKSPDPQDATKELLSSTKLAEAKKTDDQPPAQDVPDSKVPADADSKSADEKTQTAQSVDSAAEDDPVSRLKKLQARRDAIANQSVIAVLYPVEWLQLHISLLAAERFAMTRNREEFDAMHDDVLRSALKELERDAAERSPTPGQQAADDWIAVESSAEVSAEGAKLLQQTQRDFRVEPAKAPRELRDEILENRVLRRALVASVTKDLKGLSKSITLETNLERRASEIQERIFLIENLASRWPKEDQDVFPEQLATIKEVLSGQDIEWLAAATTPLDQLLDLRHQTLQLAAGKDPDVKRLRHDQWQKIAPELDEVLRTLHAAERWLCVGPEGKNLAEDRLAKARQTFDKLKQQLAASSRLAKIRDAQRFEIPFLIQYLAMRLEETSLPQAELSAAGNMAANAVEGSLTAGDFPVGQLEPVGFNRDHIEAMFQLTRDFSKPDSEVTESDEGHYRKLHEYVAGRLGDPNSVSASEVLQLLTIPHPDREKHLQLLTRQHVGVASRPSQASGRSGIWISFWSLRLVHAIEQTSSTESTADWQCWRDLVTAISESKTDVPARRVAMASLLRSRWIGAMQKLKSFHDSEEFVPENEILTILSKDVSRRVRATPLENRSLYSRIQQALPEEKASQDGVSIAVLNPDDEVSSDDFRVTIRVRVSDVAELFVTNQNDAIDLTNAKAGKDGNWFSVPVDASSETDVSLDLMLRKAPLAPTPLTIVAVDKHGAAVRRVTTRLMPPADNSWEIEVWQVKEGQPERQITLQQMQSENSLRLRLLPSTLDPMTQMDVPSQLKLRLRRTKGISKSVRIRAVHAGSTAVAWSLPEPLVFPDGETVVDIPYQSPAAPPAEGAAPITIQSAPEISRGLLFEITPDGLPEDLSRRVTSQISITPRLLGPEDVLLRPEPKYDPAEDVLVIPLVRAPYDDAAGLWPTKLPADVELSPKLQQCLMLPEARFTTPTLNADGYTFRSPFRSSEIRKILSKDGLEFGVSVAGVPHGWWWTLVDGVPRLLEGDRAQVRTFLSVDNAAEVKLAATAPNLLLGENWDKAKLTARVFIHGGQFDEGWKLQLYFLRQGTEDRLLVRDTPFEVRNRRVETVRITAGANGVWQFSTATEPYVVSAFTLGQKPVQDGTYDLNAELARSGAPEAPITSGVRFTLDKTGPTLSAENVKLSQSPTDIDGELKGTIQVIDQESEVIAVQVWLNPEMKVPLLITPGKQVKAEFTLDSSHGFPMLPPDTGKDEKKTAMLSIEAKNQAGGTTLILKSVTFFRPGKPAPMVMVPGTIVVNLKAGDKYDVSVTGKDDSGKAVMRQAPGSEGVAMFELPPGNYTVKWKPKIGSVSGKQEVRLKSNETVTTDPDKK